MHYRYCFAGVELVTHSILAFAPFVPFTFEQGNHQKIQLCFSDASNVCALYRITLKQDIANLYQTDTGWLYESNNTALQIQLAANRDYTVLTAYLPPVPPALATQQEQAFLHLLRTALECRMALQSTVSLHCACVALDGQAVAFTAPSGTGKSTRALAWVEGLGAEWISGDRPALRVTDSGVTANGVPWDGKEQIFKQIERPLLAICEVRRTDSDFVRLRRLSAAQARALLMQQCFVPMWDPEAAAAVFATIARLAQGRLVPICRVFCGQDATAARAVRDILYNHPEQIKEALPDMKIKNGFTLRDVAGEYMVMPTGDEIERFGGTLILNETGAFFWEKLQAPTAREDVLDALLAEYDIDPTTAARDLDAFLETLRTYGVLEE